MQRVAFKMQLKKGFEAEYKKRHDQIWPELAKLLKDAGISEYSIFLDPETLALFGVQNLDGSSSSQALGDSVIVRRWWAFMADIMETNPDGSPVSVSMNEMFRMD